MRCLFFIFVGSSVVLALRSSNCASSVCVWVVVTATGMLSAHSKHCIGTTQASKRKPGLCEFLYQMASMREVLQGLQEGTPPPVVLASLEQLNELLLRSGGGSGAGSLRISSIVPALCRLLASEAGSGVEVSQNPHKAGGITFALGRCLHAWRWPSPAGFSCVRCSHALGLITPVLPTHPSCLHVVCVCVGGGGGDA